MLITDQRGQLTWGVSHSLKIDLMFVWFIVYVEQTSMGFLVRHRNTIRPAIEVFGYLVRSDFDGIGFF